MIWTFALLVLAIVVTPGADMAIVVTSALGGGRVAGLAAVGGIAIGASAHILFSAAGLSALVAADPEVLALLGWAGAAYLLWLAAGFLRAKVEPALPAPGAAVAPGAALRRAIATNLLNPKAYLFVLIVFPQFIRRDGWPIGVQALLLGGLVLAIAVPVYGGLALAAARAAQGLLARPAAILLVHRGAGILLGGIGLTLAMAQANLFNPGG